MARPRSDSEAVQDRLVEIACAIIEERGGQALTMQELAARAGMSTANLYRFFDSKGALLDALAEYWFRPKVAIMEDVIASELPARRKMYEFFARRFAHVRQSWQADPATLAMYIELAAEHIDHVRSYYDLADHYLGMVIGEAMSEGYFAGLEVDETIVLIKQMVMPYCTLATVIEQMPRLSEDKLARIVDAVFDGLSAQDRGARGGGLRAA